MKLQDIAPRTETTEPIMEDLGTLKQLNVGPMINVLKQAHYSSKRGPSIAPITSKFQGQEISNTSPIIDVGGLKDGLKSLRKAYKDHDGAVGFAIYIGGHPVMFGANWEAYTLAGSSRTGRLAYDFTAFSELWDKLQTKSWAKVPATTIHDKESSEWDYKAQTSRPVTRRYAGAMKSTGELAEIFDKIMAIAKEINKPVTAKLVLSDTEARQIRQKRYKLKDIHQGFDDLNTRLKRYKLSKKPSVATIDEFIKQALTNSGKILQFAGSTYRLKGSTYNKLDPTEMLAGIPFEVSYSCEDPGSYDRLDVKFAYDPSTSMLKPIHATWYDKSDPSKPYTRQEAILEPGMWAKNELRVKSFDDKDAVIRKLLVLVKSSQFKKAADLADSLRKAGLNWPELGTIHKSASSELEKQKD